MREPRFIPDGALIHNSVLKRMAAVPEYKPINLPAKYDTAPMPVGPSTG